MADNTSDTTEVNGCIGLIVIEWRLQDGCRKYDLIAGRAIVGIDGLRGHAPLGLIDRLALLGPVFFKTPAPCIQHIFVQ